MDELNCFLEEANLLQSETDKRLERHQYSFYSCITLLAGVIGGGATVVGGKADLFGPGMVAIASLKYLTTPLAAMFFDDELLPAVTDLHIRCHIVPNIQRLVATSAQPRPTVFEDTLSARFKFLRDNRRLFGVWRPRIAANTRRILFAVPSVAAFPALDALWHQLSLGGLSPVRFYQVAFGIELTLNIVSRSTWPKASRRWCGVRCHP